MDKAHTPNRDFKGFDDYIEVFRMGEHVAADGTRLTFTADDLDQIVANHSADNPAPHVITHKELYSPFAYAQNAEVKRDGERVLVRAKNVNPDFAKLVEDGALYERSIRLRKGDAGWRMEHVAWLGAEPPAVQGMAPLQFTASQEGFDFALDTYTPSVLARMMRAFRDFLIDKFSRDEAEKILPDWEIDSLNRHANDLRRNEQDSALASEFNQSPGGLDVTGFTQEQLDAAVKKAVDDATTQLTTDFQAKLDAKDVEVSTATRQRLTLEFSAEVNKAIDAGRLLPAQTEGMAEFMAELPDADDKAFEFTQAAGGENKTVSLSPRQWFLDFVGSLGKQIELGESGAGQELDADPATDFAAPVGKVVDAERLALHRKAVNYQQQHGGTYVDAVIAIEQQGE